MGFKIAVIGQSLPPFDEAVLDSAREIGIELAKKGCTVLSGGCRGYPYESSLAAFNCGANVIAYSPAADSAEHEGEYDFPSHGFSKIEYTGLGIPKRNNLVVNNADAVILVGGKIGTLNEFTLAFRARKPIGVLKDSGGISGTIPKLAELCDFNSQKENIIYAKRPKQLVAKLLALLRPKPEKPEAASEEWLGGIREEEPWEATEDEVAGEDEQGDTTRRNETGNDE